MCGACFSAAWGGISFVQQYEYGKLNWIMWPIYFQIWTTKLWTGEFRGRLCHQNSKPQGRKHRLLLSSFSHYSGPPFPTFLAPSHRPLAFPMSFPTPVLASIASALMGHSLLAAYPCAASSLSGGLVVCPSESVYFTVPKWRLGSATLVPVDAGSFNIASSASSLSIKWDTWSISVSSFLGFIPDAVCCRPTEILLSCSV